MSCSNCSSYQAEIARLRAEIERLKRRLAYVIALAQTLATGALTLVDIIRNVRSCVDGWLDYVEEYRVPHIPRGTWAFLTGILKCASTVLSYVSDGVMGVVDTVESTAWAVLALGSE